MSMLTPATHLEYKTMEAKYKLDHNDTIYYIGRKLYRIIALRDVREDVKAGDRGGYVESDENLSHYGKAWIYPCAKVYGTSCVRGEAEVSGNAVVCGNADIREDARIIGNARIDGFACIGGNACVGGSAYVCGRAWVGGNAKVGGNVIIHGFSYVGGDAQVYKGTDFFYMGSAESTKDSPLTTLHRTKTGWLVYCGSFVGTIEEFNKYVKLIYSSKDKRLKAQYFRLIEKMLKLRIKIAEEQAEQDTKNGI